MARSRQKKIETKRAKRKKQLKENIANKQLESYRKLFPLFDVGTDGADPSFIAEVKRALGEISFDDKRWFTDDYRYFLKGIAKFGFPDISWEDIADRCARGTLSSRDEAVLQVTRRLCAAIGNAAYSLIPKEKRRNWLPYNAAFVILDEKLIKVRFSELESRRGGEFGIVSWSPDAPHIETEIGKRRFGISGHAVKSVCDRLFPKWLDEYEETVLANSLFSKCDHIEMTTLRNSARAVSIFQRCDSQYTPKYESIRTAFSDTFDLNSGPIYFRVGYFPIVPDGEFEKAKTFLYPGYRGTPERLLLESQRPKSHDLDRMTALMEDLEMHPILTAETVEVLRWFHDHGVVQVIQRRRDSGGKADSAQE